MSKNGYKYYACYKNTHNGGCYLEARHNMSVAYRDLKRLETYVNNDLIFIGVVKCKEGENPLEKVYCMK